MKIYSIYSVILFVLAAFLTNCSDNSVESDGDHADAVGLRIVSSGVTIVSYIRDSAIEGNIEVEASELSGPMNIEFYDDEKEDWFTPDAEHYLLTIEISDTTIADYWQHEGEEGGYEFHIRGKKAGNTNAVFKLIHDDHPDFVSKEIPILISETGTL